MAKIEKLTQEERVAIVNTYGPAYKVFEVAAGKEVIAKLKMKGVIGHADGLTDLGKILRQRVMEQMMEEML